MKIFLDANILFSAAKSDGAIRFLVTSLLKKKHELSANLFVQEEAERNLRAKNPMALHYFKELILQLTISSLVDFKPLPKVASYLPEKDQPVLQAALHDHCDILLTGDRTHFGKLYGQKPGSLVIHSPSSLANLIL
ncbi:MAG: PIN domain-containing protein [Chthoniobacterales bacterium]|nr:PIN domain-containing protein [Chthoniobacterales bacterium]